MHTGRRFVALASALGGIAAAWFAGAAVIWQGFHLHA